MINRPIFRRFFAANKPFKAGFLAFVLCLAIWGVVKIGTSKPTQIRYQTGTVEKGTLISAISASGTITGGNKTNITTKVSGTVRAVYVTNGERVVRGQKIAEVSLDDYAAERQTAAWIDYLSATETVKETKKNQITADIQMWKDRQSLLDAETNYKDMTAGAWNKTTNKEYTYNEKAIVTKQFEEAKLAFEVSEAKYVNSTADISGATAKATAAWRDYQANSAVIVAPTTGVVTDLALTNGILVSASTSTSTTTGSTIVSAQTVGKISDPTGLFVASVSVGEIDVTKIKAKQKVTLTLDAYENMTFTGKVLAVNTTGSSNSGVTTYPVTIILDPTDIDIYPNMAVTAQIITRIETDVLLVPSTAIKTNAEQTNYVEILKDGQPIPISVETGNSNDTQTVIKSGVSEGTEIITTTISPENRTSNSTTTSPFGSLGRTGRSETTIIRGTFTVPGSGPGGF